MEIQHPVKRTEDQENLDESNKNDNQAPPSKKAELKSIISKVDANILIPEDLDTITKLRKQMEFYLGDSNLSNDKFLAEYVTRNSKGYVDLSLFLSFNKVKKILGGFSDAKTKMNMLIEAIGSSGLLKLNKDKTKVRRRVNFEPEKVKDEINKRTIYVEDFPSNATHETLAAIFGKVGHILHVSIPKFNESKQAKGFAFIEFEVHRQFSPLMITAMRAIRLKRRQRRPLTDMIT